MVAVPVATLVKSAVHLPADSEQLADTVPTPGFDDAKLTVPVGTFEAVVVSGTDAVQLEVPPMAIVLGLHVILEDVLSFAPVGVGLVPWGDGECSRNGTRNAPIPAAMRAAAPSVRLLGTIILFSYLPLFSDPLPVWLYYSRNCTLKNLSIHSHSTSKSFRNRWWISKADILSEDSKEKVENQNIRNSH